jgi:hypothetical protein
MFKRMIRIGLLTLVLAAVAACGGGTASKPADEAGDGAGSAAEQPAGQPADAATGGDQAGDDNDDVAQIYSDDADAMVPGTTLTSCELISASDVAAAVGLAKVANGALEQNPTTLSPAHNQCTYEGDFGRVIVDLTPEDGANLYDAASGAYKGLELIDGIGDGAFWSDKNNRGFVWQDKVTVMLTIFVNDGIDPRDVTESLGKAMVDKL